MADIAGSDSMVPESLRLYTMAEAAEILRVSKSTLAHWVAAGTVACTRFPGCRRVLFSVANLEAIIDSGFTPGTRRRRGGR